MNISDLQRERDELLKKNRDPDYTEGVLDFYNVVVKMMKGR